MLLLRQNYDIFTTMATFKKMPSGKIKCEVMVNYKRYSKTFATKQEANAWVFQLENKQGAFQPANKTFGQLLERYKELVTSKKRSVKCESNRIDKFIREDDICKIKLENLSKADFAAWRDKRLQEVSALSVRREWAILRHALEISINEWEWLEKNPMKGLNKPEPPPPRDRLFSDEEIAKLCFALNYSQESDLKMVISRVGAAMLFAIETGFRAQEICNLKWTDIKGRVAKINASKTYTGIREVPLTSRALEIIDQLKWIDKSSVFLLNTSQIDSLFRQAKKKMLIEDLHFHDTRHTAITRLAQKLNILELARMVGHKDLRMLQVYYNESAENIAKKLD